MKTVPIEQAVEQTNATQVFSCAGLRAEQRTAKDHGLRHYSQGLTEKLCQECPYKTENYDCVSPEMSAMMNDHAISITTIN